ncbi:putative toxin [Nodularia spumigena CS-584]|nr:putative toxin [Nodularia spumigena CS-584]
MVEENSYYAFGLQHKGYGPASTGVGNAHAEKYKYQGQERQEELGLGWDSFKWRNYDYTIGRFFNVDPLAEKYNYNSVYAFAENKLGMGRELEGCELGPMWGPMMGVMLETTNTPPATTTMMNTARATIEVGAKSSEVVEGTSSSAIRLSQNASRGRATEAEQLAKNGFEKNTESFTRIDPHTGKENTTIPDAVKPGGGTVEIKNVNRQSLTRQLRTQRQISNEKGVKPELIINKAAKLSKPLEEGGFDIKTYNNSTIVPTVRDNTNIPKPQLPKPVQPNQENKPSVSKERIYYT